MRFTNNYLELQIYSNHNNLQGLKGVHEKEKKVQATRQTNHFIYRVNCKANAIMVKD